MTETDPRLYEIAEGWAAAGQGWAVHAATPEAATALYYERAALYAALASMPPWRERQKDEVAVAAKPPT